MRYTILAAPKVGMIHGSLGRKGQDVEIRWSDGVVNTIDTRLDHTIEVIEIPVF